MRFFSRGYADPDVLGREKTERGLRQRLERDLVKHYVLQDFRCRSQLSGRQNALKENNDVLLRAFGYCRVQFGHHSVRERLSLSTPGPPHLFRRGNVPHDRLCAAVLFFVPTAPSGFEK